MHQSDFHIKQWAQLSLISPKTVAQPLIKKPFSDSLVRYNKVNDTEDFNPGPGAHRSTAFHATV